MRHYIGGVVLLLLPFVIQVGVVDEIRVPKAKALVLVSTIIGAYLFRKFFNSSLGLAYLVLGTSVLASGMGILQSYDLIFITAAFTSCYLVNKLTPDKITIVLKFIAITGVLNALYAYLQMADLDPIFTYVAHFERTIPTGFLGQQTLFGPFMVACFICSLYLRWYIPALMILIPCIATKSSFTYLSLLAALTVYVGYQTRYRWSLLITAFAVCGLAGVFYFYGDSEMLHSRGRFEVWSKTLELWEKTPIFGRGQGLFAPIYHKYQTLDSKTMNGLFLSAHNDYIQLLFEVGIVGVLAAFYMLYDLVINFWKKRHVFQVVACFTICVVFLVNAMGNFPLRVVPQGLLALWCFTMVTTSEV